VYRNEPGDGHRLKHATIDRLLQTNVGKQHSLGSLQTSAPGVAAQQRMSKQWSMPSSGSVSWTESNGDGGSGGHGKDGRVTLSKSSSCRSATGPTTIKRPSSSLTSHVTIDVVDDDDDDDATMASQSAAAARRSVVRNSSACSSRQMLDVYYSTDIRYLLTAGHSDDTDVLVASATFDRDSVFTAFCVCLSVCLLAG